MKFFKYTLLIIGVLGLMASIFNMIRTHSISDHTEGLIAGITLLVVALNLEKIAAKIKTMKEFSGSIEK